MSNEAMSVRRSTVLPAPPERVWEALTDDGQLSRWFGADVDLDPRPGGRGTFRGPNGVRQARVDRADHARRLTLRWWPAGGDPQEAGTVDLVLDAVAAGTRLTVTETAAPGTGPTASAPPAWSSRLEGLGTHMAALVGV